MWFDENEEMVRKLCRVAVFFTFTNKAAIFTKEKRQQ